MWIIELLILVSRAFLLTVWTAKILGFIKYPLHLGLQVGPYCVTQGLPSPHTLCAAPASAGAGPETRVTSPALAPFPSTQCALPKIYRDVQTRLKFRLLSRLSTLPKFLQCNSLL